MYLIKSFHKKLKIILKNNSLKLINILFILFSVVCAFILSFFGEQFEYYGFKWHFLSTPLGLILAYTNYELELNKWFNYLLTQNAIISQSSFQIFFAILVSLISLSYILWRINKK